MSDCVGVQIAASVFAGISLVFSIAACFIPVKNVDQWVNIAQWVFGGINAAFALLVFIVLLTPIRWFLLPKIAIGIVNIAFFAFLLTLSVMTLCGTPTIIDQQVQWYYDNNKNFHDYIVDSYPDASLSRFSKEIGIFGIIITLLLLVYSAIACYITILYFLRLGKKRANTIQPVVEEENVKIVHVGAPYDHSTLTGGYGPLQVHRPVIIVKGGPPVFGVSPPPYVD